MKQLKKHAIGYNTVSSKNGVINARGVKSKPNDIQIFGYTHEIGTGEKSPDNPYVLESLDSGAMSVDGVEYEHSIILSNNGMSLQVPVPIALNSVEGVSDYIFKDENGVWKLIQMCKKYEFTSEESISLQTINNFGIANFLYEIANVELSQSFLICNCLKKQNSVIAKTYKEGYMRTDYASLKLMYIRIKVERASTVEEFKNFLAEQYENGTPLTIIYQLETPIEHTLSDYAQDLLNSFTLQNQNRVFVEGYPDIKVSGYLQK